MTTPDTAEAKIDEILTKFSQARDFPALMYEEAKAEAVRQLKGLLVDERVNELEKHAAVTTGLNAEDSMKALAKHYFERKAALQQTRQEEVRE